MTRPQQLLIDELNNEIQKHQVGLGYTKEDVRAFEFMIAKITQIAHGNTYSVNPAAYFEIKDTDAGVIRTAKSQTE